MRNGLKRVCPPLLPVFAALVAGIGTGRCPPLSGGWFGLGAGTCIVLLFLFYYFRYPLLIIFLCTATFGWGTWSMDRIHRPRLPDNHISKFADGSRYRITGTIAAFASHYPNKARLEVDCTGITGAGGSHRDVTGRIRLSVYGNELALGLPELGSRVRFFGPLNPIRNFANPGGYDYEAHMRYMGIFGTSYTGIAAIEPLPAKTPSTVLRLVRAAEDLRNRFWVKVGALGGLDRAGPATVLGALVTGKKESLPHKLRDDFSRAGTAHLLAISGFHLSLVALGVFFLFRRVLSLAPPLAVSGQAGKLAGLLTLMPLAAYALFTGFSPSTQRALVMVAVFMAAMAVERQKDLLNTLCLAGILILLVDPPSLYSISFQLSFTAVLFIILGLTRVHRSGWMPGKKIYAWGAGLFWVSLFAGLGTFPLTALYFNTISYVQVVSNMVAVPVMGFICLPLGFAGLLLMDLFPAGASWILERALDLVGLCIRYIEFITGFGWSWSRAVTPDGLDMALLYLVMGTGFLVWAKPKRSTIFFLGLAIAAGAVSVSLKLVQRFSPGRMTITVLDTGQSNTAVIRTPEGRVILVDCGGFGGRSAFDPGRFIAGPFLWRHWIKHIDAVILTHPESDHMDGLLFIMNNFNVGQWIRNRDVRRSKAFSALEAAAAGRGIPQYFPADTIQRLKFDRVSLDLFPRYGRKQAGDFNNNSLVCRIEYGNFSMVFPGDIEAEREADLVLNHRERLASKVLLAPHHGSRGSSSKIFLDQIRPEGIIVSCGYNNRYGFPHPETLERYAQTGVHLFRTDLQGAVIVTASGNGYDITTQRKH